MPLFFPPAYEYLGGARLAAASSVTAIVSIAPRDLLFVQVQVTGYSGGGDQASLRFNSDTGANYAFKHATAATNSSAWTVSTGVPSTSRVVLFPTAIGNGRSATITISNPLGSEKIGSIDGASGAGSSATAPTLEKGVFTWAGASTQITSIQMITAAGNPMSSASGFAVFGRNMG